MHVLRKFLLALATLAVVGAATLVSSPAASAQEPALPPTAPAVMTSAGCDSDTYGPPAGFDFNKLYDGWLWLDACEECDSGAQQFAAYGYPTWCWETARPAQLAELWVGPYGGGIPATPDQLRPATPEDFAQLEKLKQAAAAGR
jgi:ABC-type transport system substrate-binding protein